MIRRHSKVHEFAEAAPPFSESDVGDKDYFATGYSDISLLEHSLQTSLSERSLVGARRHIEHVGSKRVSMSTCFRAESRQAAIVKYGQVIFA